VTWRGVGCGCWIDYRSEPEEVVEASSNRVQEGRLRPILSVPQGIAMRGVTAASTNQLTSPRQ
jgi:hypothetical protein